MTAVEAPGDPAERSTRGLVTARLNRRTRSTTAGDFDRIPSRNTTASRDERRHGRGAEPDEPLAHDCLLRISDSRTVGDADRRHVNASADMSSLLRKLHASRPARPRPPRSCEPAPEMPVASSAASSRCPLRPGEGVQVFANVIRAEENPSTGSGPTGAFDVQVGHHRQGSSKPYRGRRGAFDVIVAIDEREFLFLVHETPMFALQVMRSRSPHPSTRRIRSRRLSRAPRVSHASC